MKRFQSLWVGIGTLILSALSSQAVLTFTLDDFRDGFSVPELVANPGQVEFDASVLTIPEMAGTARVATLANDPGSFLSISAETNNDSLGFSAKTLSSGALTLDYLLTAPTDITIGGGDEIVIDISDSDNPPNPATVFIAFASGLGALSNQVAIPAFIGSFTIPLSAFAGVDFTQVTDMQLVIEGSQEFDGRIALVGVQSSTGVPEPSASLALLLVLAGVTNRRKRG